MYLKKIQSRALIKNVQRDFFLEIKSKKPNSCSYKVTTNYLCDHITKKEVSETTSIKQISTKLKILSILKKLKLVHKKILTDCIQSI